ncbi:uncharacterized protein METZ01_LOCUS428111, partial [marine metagenome]
QKSRIESQKRLVAILAMLLGARASPFPEPTTMTSKLE